MKKKIIFIIIFFVFFSKITITLYSQNISLDQYSNNLMQYFQNPNNNVIYQTIEVYKLGLRHENLESTVIFFFHGIKASDIERYNYFSSVVRQSGIQELINIFRLLDGDEIEIFLLNPVIHPELIDAYWTLYFSSGDEAYLQNIIDIILNYRESEDFVLYMSARGAIVTYKMNIRTYPTVMEYLINNTETELSSYIIERSFQEMERDTMEYIRMQREIGNW